MKRTPPPAATADEAIPPGLAEPLTDSARQKWIEPRVTELPRLNEITLQSGGIPGGGGTGGGGSTVVP